MDNTLGTAPTQAQQPSEAVMTIGYICAFLLPPVGFVIGTVALAKGKGGHAIAIMAISVVVFALVLRRAFVL